MRTKQEIESELERIKPDPDWTVRFDTLWWSQNKTEQAIRNLLSIEIIELKRSEYGTPRYSALNQAVWALRWVLEDKEA